MKCEGFLTCVCVEEHEHVDILRVLLSAVMQCFLLKTDALVLIVNINT